MSVDSPSGLSPYTFCVLCAAEPVESAGCRFHRVKSPDDFARVVRSALTEKTGKGLVEFFLATFAGIESTLPDESFVTGKYQSLLKAFHRAMMKPQFNSDDLRRLAAAALALAATQDTEEDDDDEEDHGNEDDS